MNIWDVLILAVIAAAVIFAVCRIRKGKSSCCDGNCEACAGCANAKEYGKRR